MVDVYETQVKVSFVVPQGEVNRISNLVNAALSKSTLGRVGGIGSLIGKAGMALGAGAAIAGAIVVSSPSLQNTLKHLTQTVMLLIRPIGDIIAVGLRPIIDILRPIGLFFRILIQPYIRKAMEAMRLGRGFLAKGETEQAASAYALGIAFLLKPIFDMMVTIATISVEGILSGIKLLGMALLSVVPFAEGVSQAFGEMMDGAILNVGLGGAKIITETSIMMETWLVNLKSDWKLVEDTANVSMGLFEGFVGEGFVRIIQAATTYFAPNLENEIKTAFDNIVEYAREKVDELNALLNKQRTQTGFPSIGLGFTSKGELAFGTPVGTHISGAYMIEPKPNIFNIDEVNVNTTTSWDDMVSKIEQETGWSVKKK